MRHRRLRLLLAATSFLFLAPAPAAGGDDAFDPPSSSGDPVPSITAAERDGPIEIDGVLDEQPENVLILKTNYWLAL